MCSRKSPVQHIDGEFYEATKRHKARYVDCSSLHSRFMMVVINTPPEALAPPQRSGAAHKNCRAAAQLNSFQSITAAVVA
jgi:hypothetical protein